MIHLIYNRYESDDDLRQEELDFCERKNQHLIVKNLKGVITALDGRPTFDQMMDVAIDGAINIISNSDIYFDRSINLLTRIKWDNTLVALSRWDMDSVGNMALYNHSDSQDVFCFRGRVPPIGLEYPLGTPGIDNKALYLFKERGFRILNPGKSIRAIHVHNSNVRTYLKAGNGEARDPNKIFRIPPPYHRLHPHELIPEK